MPANPSCPEVSLPRGWPSQVRSAILHVISLAQFTLAYTRGWAANSPNSRIRLKAELGRARQNWKTIQRPAVPPLPLPDDTVSGRSCLDRFPTGK